MLVEISKIKVGERIRKDFGDIQELADDIKENSLLNPIVVTPDGDGYLLIAGERRLKACQLLGYAAITVTTVGVRDAEQALAMEISENECRKEFTKTERLSYARRLAAIESVKAKERMTTGKNDPSENSRRGRTDEIVAETLGIGSANTYRREQAIADNADVFTVEEFKEWDEGRLSTNKAFQMMKERLAEAEDRASALETQCQYERQRRVEAESQPPKEVVREVVPEDYESLKHDLGVMKSENSRLFGEKEKFAREAREAVQRIEEMERQTAEGKQGDKAIREMRLFAVAVKDLLHLYGSVMWVLDSLEDADESTRNNFINSIKIGYAYFNVLMNDIGGLNGIVNE